MYGRPYIQKLERLYTYKKTFFFLKFLQESLFNLKRDIQRCHRSKVPEYEEDLTKGKIEYSVDENLGESKQTKISNIKVIYEGFSDRSK